MTVHRVVAQEWIVLQARLVASPPYFWERERRTGMSNNRLELFEE